MVYVAFGIAAFFAILIVGIRGSLAGLLLRFVQIGGAVLGIIVLGFLFTHVLPYVVAAALWVGLLLLLVVAFVSFLSPSK